MKQTRAQKKSEMLAYSEELIEELLDWEERNPRPNLEQMEEEILKLRKRLGEEMVKVIAEGQEARQPVASPRCEQCGQAMRYKGEKKKAVESRLGTIELVRGHYYCNDCKSGLFPP